MTSRETFAQAVREMRERIESGQRFADDLLALWNRIDREACKAK